jgi:hypothetical protein
VHKCGSLLCGIYMLCALSMEMPSKTQEYNYANILSQIVLITTYLSTMILAVGESGDAGADKVEYTMLGLQAGMMVYLIYISSTKLYEMVQQSKKEVAAEFAEDAEAGMILAFRFFDQDGSQTINLSEFHGVTTVVGVEFTKLERQACRY